jgi:putative phosphoribosyl transferase
MRQAGGIPMGNVRILSRSNEAFDDRATAGRLLAAELAEYRGRQPVILGVPRGGVIVAREVAHALDGVVDVVLAHKLGAPGHTELALGAVAENGRLFLNASVVATIAIDDAYIEAEKARQMVQIRRRTEMIRKVRPKVPLKGRTVILTDDGVATGATTQAALWAVRLEQPEKLVAAIPVGPEETILELGKLVDDMVCLRCPPSFFAVGQFYSHFSPVEDEDMLRVLADQTRSRVNR